jgi:hypothetical protein
MTLFVELHGARLNSYPPKYSTSGSHQTSINLQFIQQNEVSFEEGKGHDVINGEYRIL